MGDEVDGNIIQSTQSSLGKYVKRPPLTEKLLKKPPFRFIHDIITTVLKTTGFFNNLFEEHELQSENVKERENKIQFLNKVIFVVGATTGKTLSVKPSKVISGQEPEKTNELLQCIALALDNKLSSDDAVQKYKNSVSKSRTSETKPKDVKKAIKESSKVKVSSKNASKSETNAKNEINIKAKSRDIIKKESPPKKSIRPAAKNSTEKTKNDDTIKKVVRNESSRIIDNNIEALKNLETNEENLTENKNTILLIKNNISTTETDKNDSLTFSADSNLISQLDQSNNKEINEEKKIDPLKEQQLQLLEIGNEREAESIKPRGVGVSSENEVNVNDGNIIENKENNMAAKETDNSPERISKGVKAPYEPKLIRPVSVRPSSSRPGAPRLREKHEETVAETDNLLIGKVNIIAEHAVQEEDEDSSIIVVQNNIDPKSEIDKELAHLDSNEHGHLVQQILDSQKEFSQATGKTEIEWQFTAKKARDAITEEIDQLRFNLQALSRVANPLGKLLDHVQEDVEVMRQELQHWTETYEDANRELQRQKKSNEEKLKPLRAKIKQLNAEIADKHDKITDLKITIHKNASRIDKLLSNGNKQ